ncbi:hypothetical protein [Arthrobacter agilis]|uniref:hypothetical protein n=1 Tax=Arthrobacter agilis TaxID=37921 RepID=UPI0027815BBE|nr:hypothetical protein [Arthrobacter agilis]MDQ0735304.1 hypothetical protein [Arthrobacter agilis]
MLADPLEAACKRLDATAPRPAMPVAVTLETLNLTSEGLTAEIREVITSGDNHIEVVSTDGDLLLTLTDKDCEDFINALTNVWRARAATALDNLKETS